MKFLDDDTPCDNCRAQILENAGMPLEKTNGVKGKRAPAGSFNRVPW